MKAISINGLTKKYQKQTAVKELSLEINQGEMFGFIGPNGAGKSTTIKMLLNLIFPTSGEAQIFGLDCVRDSVAIKEITGYVSSDVRYYANMSSQDIFNYVVSFHQIENANQVIGQYLDLFEISPNKKISELSLGNKKKIAIVSALLQQPKLLILDEPTNGLDPRMQHRLFEVLLAQQKNGLTVFLSSHDLHEIQAYCERAAFIKNGEIIALERIDRGASGGKRISLLSSDVASAEVEAIGGTILTEQDQRLEFLYSADMTKLLSFLGSKQISDITIRPLELEDKFLGMYE